MNAIHIHTTLHSEILHLPELRPLLGKTVEIIVREESPAPVIDKPSAEGRAYEPASALLERIRAARAGTGPAKKALHATK